MSPERTPTVLFPPDELDVPDGTLRALRPGDGPALYTAVQGSRMRIGPATTWVDTIETADDAEAVARECWADFLLDRHYVFGVFGASGTLYGVTGYWLNAGPLSHRTAEVGGWTRWDAARMGIGVRTGRALVRWGFEDWPWERLYATCTADNERGIQLAERIGLRREGVLRGVWSEYEQRRADHVVLGMLRSDYEPADYADVAAPG